MDREQLVELESDLECNVIISKTKVYYDRMTDKLECELLNDAVAVDFEEFKDTDFDSRIYLLKVENINRTDIEIENEVETLTVDLYNKVVIDVVRFAFNNYDQYASIDNVTCLGLDKVLLNTLKIRNDITLSSFRKELSKQWLENSYILLGKSKGFTLYTLVYNEEDNSDFWDLAIPDGSESIMSKINKIQAMLKAEADTLYHVFERYGNKEWQDDDTDIQNLKNFLLDDKYSNLEDLILDSAKERKNNIGSKVARKVNQVIYNYEYDRQYVTYLETLGVDIKTLKNYNEIMEAISYDK